MSPTTSDFSQILELQQYRKLYEEQEEKQQLQLAEKDEAADNLTQKLSEREQQIHETQVKVQELQAEQEKMRSEYNRLRTEAQEKIDKLADRIKELNKRLLDK